MAEQTSEHLRVASPSNTAVKYTISSRTREPAKFVSILRHVFRIVVAFYTTVATIAKLQMTLAREIDPDVEQILESTLLYRLLRLIIDNAPWWVLCITSLFTLYLCVRRDYTGWLAHLRTNMNDVLILDRREPARSARSGGADFNKLFVLFSESDDYIHTYHANPRYCDS